MVDFLILGNTGYAAKSFSPDALTTAQIVMACFVGFNLEKYINNLLYLLKRELN